MIEIISYIFLGMFAGFSAGLLGIGGGLITVPALAFLLPIFHGPGANWMLVAIATSLAAIIPTAMMSAYGHAKRQAIVWPVARQFAPGLAAGSICGAALASQFESHQLAFGFGIFVLFVSVYLQFGQKLIKNLTGAKRKVHGLAAVPIGVVSAFMGVGGGTMTVPYLVWRGLDMHKAVGTSAFCGIPIAITGSITFFFVQTVVDHQSMEKLIDLTALTCISLGTVTTASLGAKTAHILPVSKVRLLFSVTLFAVSIKLLTQN